MEEFSKKREEAEKQQKFRLAQPDLPRVASVVSDESNSASDDSNTSDGSS